MTACSVCGIEPLEDARFCHGCGSQVGPSEAAAEYKQVTVLFADVVHSMDIAAAVGAERLREIMTELVEPRSRGGAALRRDGGQVHRRRHHGGLRSTGGVGYDAFRACLAALDLQVEAHEVSAPTSMPGTVSTLLSAWA